MEYYDFVCDEDIASLRLLHRGPDDRSEPLEQLRIHIGCSDCVAQLDVNAESWAGFARLFTHDYKSCEAAAWISPAGEWKLHIEKDNRGDFVIESELDSLLDYHRWVLHTSFRMSEERFRKTATEVLSFIGMW